MPALSEKEQINCAEANLRKLIYPKIYAEDHYSGNVSLYLTVTKEGQITNIHVSSNPNSETINELMEKALGQIEFKPGKYREEIVTSRLWTYFTFPSSSKELFSDSLARMLKDENPKYENYEYLIWEASQYIFSNPVYPNGKEFTAASQIVGFWMDKDMAIGIPTFGDFHTSLTNENQQQFLYITAMINYGLTQKLNHGRLLECKPKEGEIYREQKDVREVQLEGAKLLLAFIGDADNNVPMTPKTKKYFKAFEKGRLEVKLFE